MKLLFPLLVFFIVNGLINAIPFTAQCSSLSSCWSSAILYSSLRYCAYFLDETSDSREIRYTLDFDWFWSQWKRGKVNHKYRDVRTVPTYYKGFFRQIRTMITSNKQNGNSHPFFEINLNLYKDINIFFVTLNFFPTCVPIFSESSKTVQFRDGAWVAITRSKQDTCEFTT